jgi:hypothetical protein
MEMKQFATQLPEDILIKLKEHSDKTGIKIWKIVFDALIEYFKNNK